jgi:hypothetical protein
VERSNVKIIVIVVMKEKTILIINAKSKKLDTGKPDIVLKKIFVAKAIVTQKEIGKMILVHEFQQNVMAMIAGQLEDKRFVEFLQEKVLIRG